MTEKSPIVQIAPPLLYESVGFTFINVNTSPGSSTPAWYRIGGVKGQPAQELALVGLDFYLASGQPSGAVDLYNVGTAAMLWGSENGVAGTRPFRAWIVIAKNLAGVVPDGQWVRRACGLPGLSQDGRGGQGGLIYAIPIPSGNSNSETTKRVVNLPVSFPPVMERIRENDEVSVYLVVDGTTADAWSAGHISGEVSVGLRFAKNEKPPEFI